MNGKGDKWRERFNYKKYRSSELWKNIKKSNQKTKKTKKVS